MALIGYARVSTTEQHLHLQQDALTAAGCLKIFTDTISGAKAERKGLAEALEYIRAGDILAVWRLDQGDRILIAPTAPLYSLCDMLLKKG
jgi:DNA invertase Pin-like site-specific DNA recombinase